MFFAHPYKKAILSVLKSCPLFKERWFFDAKDGDTLILYYHHYETPLEKITGGGASFSYTKSGTFEAMLTFPFLEDDPRFERLTGALDTVPDDGIDDIRVYAERNHSPEPRSVAVITVNGVTKETVKKTAERLCEALTDILDAYGKGVGEEA